MQQQADMLAQESMTGGPTRNAEIPDGGHSALTRAAAVFRVVGGRGHPQGKPRDAPGPQNTTPTSRSEHRNEEITMIRPMAASCEPRNTGTRAEAVEKRHSG
jgi:hypothetical protein